MWETECTQLDSELTQMWSEHKQYLRRLLISLTHDVDVAEDLVQETYLKARNGLADYRGGNAKAWLSAIARNAFYSHMRSRYVRSELPLEDHEAEPADDWLGSASYLAGLELRHAIVDLAPDQRTALIMKHYGGFTYREIGEYLGCPTGTVQRRVWTAMQRLRTILAGSQKELAVVKCEELRGIGMLDYLYGALPADESAAMGAHLDECPECRKEVEQLRGLMTALDALDEEYKSTGILELDKHGGQTGYYSLSLPNPYDKPTSTVEFGSGSTTEILHVFMQGEEVRIEKLPTTDDQSPKYRARLDRPLAPGGRLDMQFVFHQPCQPDSYLGDGRWRSSGHWQLTEKSVVVIAVRLPCGAHLEHAEPQPDKITRGMVTTALWRRLMQPVEELDISVEYMLGAKTDTGDVILDLEE